MNQKLCCGLDYVDFGLNLKKRFIDFGAQYHLLAAKTSAQNVKYELRKAKLEGMLKAVELATSDVNFVNVEAIYKFCPDLISPAFGCHPLFLIYNTPDWESNLKSYLLKYPSSMIGLIGFDFLNGTESRLKQVMFLTAQLKIAQDLARPVIVSCKGPGAHEQLFETLLKYYNQNPKYGYRQKFILQAYEGGWIFAQKLIEEIKEVDFYFSFSLQVLDEQQNFYTMRRLPETRIQIESGAPNWGSYSVRLIKFMDKIAQEYNSLDILDDIYNNSLAVMNFN